MNILEDEEFLEFTGKQESQFIVPSADFLSESLEEFFPTEEVYEDLMPWSKTHGKVAFRPGEVSIWAGINGHYKSLLTGMIALFLCKTVKTLIASLEMMPKKTYRRLIIQASHGPNPTQQFIEDFHLIKTKNLWLYDQNDTIPQDRMLAMINYAASKYGIEHFFIDSLMKCGVGTEDYDAQKNFVDHLCWSAKRNKVHIHLIHHIRKGSHGEQRPNKWDIKGSGAITDLVDNVFIVWKNKPKEAAEEKARFDPSVDYNEEDPDLFLEVAKQRNGEWEETIALWMHKQSLQLVGRHDGPPFPF